MEWLLEKAIEAHGETYSPQQVAELLNAHSEAIERIGSVFEMMLLILMILAAMNLFCIFRLDRRLKKLEK